MRTLLYFPLTHGCREPKYYADVENDLTVREDYFKMKRYFDTEFWTEFSHVKCLYLYIDSLPSLDVSSSVNFLRENNLHPIGWTVDEYVAGMVNHPTTPKIAKFAYQLPSYLKIPCKFIGTENPEWILNTNNAFDVLDKTPHRDKYIATRIFETLPDESVGVLFMGKRHNVAHFLPSTVVVKFPIGKMYYEYGDLIL